MSHSCDGTYDVYNERFPRARKPHRCEACKRNAIRPGDVYARVFILYEGRKETVIRCMACQLTHEHLRELCHGKDMWPDEELDCGLDYAEEWDGPPPEHIAALAFWQPGDPLPCTRECTSFEAMRIDYSKPLEARAVCTGEVGYLGWCAKVKPAFCAPTEIKYRMHSGASYDSPVKGNEDHQELCHG